MQSSHSSLTPKIVGALVIFTVVSSGAYYFLLRDHLKNSAPNMSSTLTTSAASTPQATTTLPPTTTPIANANQSTATQPSSDSSAPGFKDGMYTATGSYSVPHGEVNSITVNVMVKDGTITAVNETNDYKDRESSFYINSFDQEISGTVVGKKLSAIGSLSRVGGASLTTRGFNTALQSVISQAQA